MAFGSTLTITINGVAKILNRINQDNYGSEYFVRGSAEEYRIKIRHSKQSPGANGVPIDVHNIELSHIVFATASVIERRRSMYMTVKVENTDNALDAGYMVAGFLDYVDLNTVYYDLLNWVS